MPEQNDQKPLEGEVVNPENNPSPANVAEEVTQALLDPSKNKNGIFIGTLNLVTTPVRALAQPLKKHYHRKYHKRYTHAKKIFVLDMFLVGLAIALLGVSLFLFFTKPKQNYLTVGLENSNEVTSGAARDFVFTINNSKKNSVSETQVNFTFPKSFAFKKYPDQFDTKTDSLTVGIIKEKEPIKLNFSGTLWGALNEKQEIIVKTHYKDLKTNEWQDEANIIPVKITASALKTEWSIPEETRLGQNFNVSINYQNTSSEILPRAIIIPVLPSNFQIVSSNVDLVNGRFILENIPAGKGGQIIITGFLKGLSKTNALTMSLQSFLEYDTKQYLQNDSLKTLTVKDNDVTLDFKLADNKTFFRSGEEAILVLSYKNNSKIAIKDLSLALSLPPEATDGRVDKIILDKKTVPSLASLAAGENGQTELKFKIATNLGETETLGNNFSLELQPSLSFYPENETQTLLRSFAETQNVKISTYLTLHAESRYFTEDGDQLGRGPLPPKINQPTKYWINLFITATPNSIKNVKISGSLPQGSTWTNHTTVTEGESIKFDPVTRTFIWQNDYLEATPGNHCPCSGIGFEVSVTPTNIDLGKILSLVENLKISGTDIYTNEYLEKTAANLTTDLKTDSYAKDKSKVTE